MSDRKPVQTREGGSTTIPKPKAPKPTAPAAPKKEERSDAQTA